MKCCGHEKEDKSNTTRDGNGKDHENHEDHSGHGNHSGHSGCCGGGSGGIVKWLFIGVIVALLILFIRGMI